MKFTKYGFGADITAKLNADRKWEFDIGIVAFGAKITTVTVRIVTLLIGLGVRVPDLVADVLALKAKEAREGRLT